MWLISGYQTAIILEVISAQRHQALIWKCCLKKSQPTTSNDSLFTHQPHCSPTRMISSIRKDFFFLFKIICWQEWAPIYIQILDEYYVSFNGELNITLNSSFLCILMFLGEMKAFQFCFCTWPLQSFIPVGNSYLRKQPKWNAMTSVWSTCLQKRTK